MGRNMFMPDSYIFDCPIHGWEKQVFCFRAFQEKFFEYWWVAETKIRTPNDEEVGAIQSMIEERRKRMPNGPW